MLLFVIGHFFERRPRRRGCARDSMPLGPLVDVMAFWALFVCGCFFTALAGAAVVARTFMGVPLERGVVIVAVAMGVLAPVCLWFSFRFLWRLTRRRQ
ncbi:MAG: hypothetical protein ABI837_00500 [Acidobacteriota bacterium]